MLVGQLFELSGGGGGGKGSIPAFLRKNLHPCDLPRRARACVCVCRCI